ncbi:hypothetical protein Avbf_05684 [Armadillidium vulgare]|nr:hypothetical protein Avbf_05684 [Armadillidium vulgare]
MTFLNSKVYKSFIYGLNINFKMTRDQKNVVYGCVLTLNGVMYEGKFISADKKGNIMVCWY